MVPAEIGDDLGTDYDWQLLTVPQTSLDGHAVRLNQGKVVGGGTILNGMVWTRSSARDYDVWADLNDDATMAAAGEKTAAYSWRWADLLPYFQKVSPCVVAQGGAMRCWAPEVAGGFVLYDQIGC